MVEERVFEMDRVERALRDEIPEIGVLWMESAESTNREARELARLGALAWTVIVAGRQSKGRGRYQRPWASPPGGLYQSVLLRVPDSAGPITLIPLLAGLALKEGIERELAAHGAGAFPGRLKWPNDLVTDRGKLAGILCEAARDDGEWEIIIGAGLNLAPVELSFPGFKTAETATSLAEEHPSVAWRREDVLIAYLHRLHHWLAVWRDDPGAVRAAWLEAADIEGRHVEASSAGKRIRGVAKGISEIGALIVETGEGVREINAAEALIVRKRPRY
ncbi:MAG: Bifunctional ligase/repressor BirA [Calditrichaeota bacterium]|nr:Bifunctional ligase/repressor BirA [Calditrichota bacterium]